MRWLLVMMLGFAWGCDSGEAAGDGDSDRQEPDDTKYLSIVGGTNTSIEQLPWQVSLQLDGGHICGGSIVAARWVITAAHCVEGLPAERLSVVAGRTFLSDTQGQTRQVAGRVPYPGYLDVGTGLDIAVVQLAAPLSLNGTTAAAVDIMTPELAAAGYAAPGRVATVSGWGSLRVDGPSPDQLQRVDVPLVSDAVAAPAYGGYPADQLAAGAVGLGGKDSCQGDSGGPLVVSGPDGPLLIGVVSWGEGCGDPNFAGLYTRVSDYRQWIEGFTGDITPSSDVAPPNQPPTTELPPAPPSSPATTSGDLTAGGVVVFGPYDVTSAGFVQAQLGGSGDPDLYVRFDAQPTVNAFDCRSWEPGSGDVCRLDVPPGASVAYVMVHASTSSNYFLKVDVAGTPSATPPPSTTTPAIEQTEQFTGAVQPGTTDRFPALNLAANTRLRVVLAGSGDADVYVRFGAPPTRELYDCRPFRVGSAEECSLQVPAGGAQAHVMVDGHLPSQYWLNLTYTLAP